MREHPLAPTAADSARSRLPGDVPAWGVVSFFSDLSHEAVTSVLPSFVSVLGGTPAALGTIEGVADALSAFAKLGAGRLADLVQRPKRWTLGAYGLTALAMPAMAFARSWPMVAALRAAGWMGRGFRSPLRDAMLVRATPPALRGRAFGLERALDQLGAVTAPLCVLALVGLSVGPRTILAATAIPGLAAIFGLLFFVRDRPPSAGAVREATPPERLPAPLVRLLAAVGLFGCGDFAKTLLILWVVGAGVRDVEADLVGMGAALYAWFNAVSVVAAYAAGRFSDRWGRKPLLLGGYLAGAAAALVPVLAAPGWIAGVLALGLSGWLVGAEEAVERAWVADLAGHRHGRAFGGLHAINGSADLVASLGVGALWTAFGPAAGFGAAAVAMVAGTLLVWRVPEHRAA